MNATLLSQATSLCTSAMQSDPIVLERYLTTCQCEVCEGAKSKYMPCEWTTHTQKFINSRPVQMLSPEGRPQNFIICGQTQTEIPDAPCEDAAKGCIALGNSSCKALRCNKVYGRWNCAAMDSVDMEEAASQSQIVMVPSSDCYDIPTFYEDPEVLAGRYNISADPQCTAEEQPFAEAVCSEVLMRCNTPLNDFFDSCVQDVCSDIQGGMGTSVAEEYCFPPNITDGDSGNSNNGNGDSDNSNNGNAGSGCINGLERTSYKYKIRPSGGVDARFMYPCRFHVPYDMCGTGHMTPHIINDPAELGGCVFIQAGATHGQTRYVYNLALYNTSKQENYSPKQQYICCGPDRGSIDMQELPENFEFPTVNQVLPPEEVCCKNAPLRPYDESPPLSNVNFVSETVGSCKLYMDPHIWTFGVKMYGYFYSGLFWVLKSAPLWIQSRFGVFGSKRPGRSMPIQVAIGGPILQGNTIMIENQGVWWNDVFHAVDEHFQPLTYLNGAVSIALTMVQYSIHLTKKLEVSLPFGIKLQTSTGSSRKTRYLRITILKMRPIEGQTGLCVSDKPADAETPDSSQALIPPDSVFWTAR